MDSKILHLKDAAERVGCRGPVSPAGGAPATKECVNGRNVSKLFKLKEWLTLEDAAQHLSTILGEDVREADVLQLALDGRLKLSVRFVNHAYARRGRVVPLENAETFDSINLGEDVAESDVLHVDLSGPRFENMNPGTTSRVIGGLHIREGEKFELDGEIAPLDGVWDLPMIGAERFDVMHEYEKQTGGPGVTSVCSDGAFVEGTDGTLFQLQKNFDESKYCWNHADNYYPAGGLPSDSVFVVRCSAIQDFEARIADTSSASTVLDTQSSGFPGRPSKAKHLIEQEFRRRAGAGELCSALAEEARTLLDWVKGEHPDAPPPTVKTISNNHRSEYNRISKNSARN